MTRNYKIYLALLTFVAVAFNVALVIGKGTISLSPIFFGIFLALLAASWILEATDSRRARRSSRSVIYSLTFLIWSVLSLILVPTILNAASVLDATNRETSEGVSVPAWPIFVLFGLGVLLELAISKLRIKGIKKGELFK
jgi:hypothetical protein